MQEGQDNTQTIHTQPSAESVGFPTQSAGQPKKGFPKLLIVGILGLLLIAGGAFFLLRGSEETAMPTPTPGLSDIEGIDNSYTPAPQITSTPTATPATVDKSAISVQILNGTGIPGEAGYLETQLKGLGYTKTQTGNASGPSVTSTTATFSSKLSSSVVNEITTKLQAIYKTVETKTSSSASTYDIQIVIGLRKGATPKPGAASATPTASAKPSSSPSPTASPSATP